MKINVSVLFKRVIPEYQKTSQLKFCVITSPWLTGQFLDNSSAALFLEVHRKFLLEILNSLAKNMKLLQDM